jgi:hypothetical protein
MSDYTLSVILSIVQDLTYTVLFLVCVVVSYFTLRQPKVKQWLAEAGLLVKAVVFVAVAALLYSAIDGPVYDILSFPRALINRESGFTASIQCFGGLAVLIGLAAGVGLLTRERNAPEE